MAGRNSGKARIAILESDAALRDDLCALLAPLDINITTHASAEAFLQQCRPDGYDCLIADVELSGMSGLDLLPELGSRGIDIPAIIVSDICDVPTAVRAMQAGAFDFIERPYIECVLVERVRHALAQPSSSSPDFSPGRHRADGGR